MSGQKHTPGPWHVRAVFPDPTRGHRFEPVVSIVARSTQLYATFRLADIPDVAGRDTEEMANAQLIAAAPELLAALVQLYNAASLATLPRDSILGAAFDAAREAIAKAQS